MKILQESNENFANSTKCWICVNDYIHNDFKVRDCCRVTKKYRGSVHQDCNIKVITQGVGKFNLKINVILIGSEKYLSFSINDNLRFIDSLQFLKIFII